VLIAIELSPEIAVINQAIKVMNKILRKPTRNRRIFPEDESVFKTMYLAIQKHPSSGLSPFQYGNQP
jgi:transposase-like protein